MGALLTLQGFARGVPVFCGEWYFEGAAGAKGPEHPYCLAGYLINGEENHDGACNGRDHR